jgi:MFS family permease
MDRPVQGRLVPWIVLGLLSAVFFGNSYVYDSIGPVADLLQKQRGYSDGQIGMLNAIYSLPNIVLVLVGGLLVDRWGAGRVLLGSTAVCLAGALLTAFGADFTEMTAGRLLFGIGAETQNIAVTVAVVDWFGGGAVALAMATTLAVGRSGSWAADMSPTWFADAYAAGWQPPLEIAAAIAAAAMLFSIAYWRFDAARDGAVRAARESHPRITLADVREFGRPYWYLLTLCVLWYAVILAFRSTFSIKYFQHAHGLPLADAGAMNSYVFLAALFATPAFGWLCDRTGRYSGMLLFGAALLPVALAIMAWTDWSLWVATVLIGISYSMVPAVMWPLASKIVPAARFGTALGLMWVVQNAGIAGANLVAGWLNDRAGASDANPAGYLPMMEFFGAASALGVAFAALLWMDRRRARQRV